MLLTECDINRVTVHLILTASSMKYETKKKTIS